MFVRLPNETHTSDKTMSYDVNLKTSMALMLTWNQIADVLGGYDVYGGPKNLAPAIKSGAQFPVNEPLVLIPAMAAATKSLGFGVTISTTYEHPYHLARRLSTADHLSGGRYVATDFRTCRKC
jgi:alkanesulfonate monooxygenase SsuD/methylene tetrahydromethanopterin reductase-like flavin-dependent oxidoreductase (luciferase family)